MKLNEETKGLIFRAIGALEQGECIDTDSIRDLVQVPKSCTQARECLEKVVELINQLEGEENGRGETI